MSDANYTDIDGAMLRRSRAIAAGDVSTGRSGLARSIGGGGALGRADQPGQYVPGDDELPFFTFGVDAAGFGNSQFLP